MFQPAVINNFKLLLMKKAILTSFYTYEQQFKNGLYCSSIRLNDEEYNDIMENRNTNRKANRLQPKKYEENSLNGLEQSLGMSADQDKILELIRSKSAADQRPKDDKAPSLQNTKSGLQDMKSLYNTSSFDEMTMKMSINKASKNISHLHNLAYMTENQEQSQLRKPSEMQKYKDTCADHEMKIMISQINRNTDKLHTGQSESAQAQHQRQPGTKNVGSFINNQSLLGSLKCSNVESLQSKRIQESFYEPYFKVASLFLKQNRQQNEKNIIQVKQPIGLPNLHVIVPKLLRSPETRLKSPQTGKSHNKKITLRDYIQLNELTSKNMDKDPSQSSLSSPLTPAMDRRQSFSRKKKTATSKNQVFGRIKSEIVADLKLMQSNIQLLSESFRGKDEKLDPKHYEIMKLYTVSRMIKQKMLMGNDQIVKFLKESDEKKDTHD